MVGVQEAIPFRESASALFDGEKALFSGIERNETGHFARRINLPAKATIFNESEPSIVIYQLTSGVARLYKALADGSNSISESLFSSSVASASNFR